MKMNSPKLTLAMLVLLAAAPVCGDRVRRNETTIRFAESGRCFAQSEPAEPWGDKGVTKIFQVEAEHNRLLETYDWFGSEIHLRCGVGGVVVRLESLSDGDRAAAEDFALGFYANGATVAEYSTLDLAGGPDNVKRTVSHYYVIERVTGFQRSSSGRPTFGLETTDGRTLTFDPATGALSRSEAKRSRTLL